MPPPVRPPASVFVRFCKCLNRFEVDYLVVGSEAVAFHAVPRAKDLADVKALEAQQQYSTDEER